MPGYPAFGQAQMETLDHLVQEYIHQNLDFIVSENLDRIKEIISEIESEKEAKKEE